MQHCVDPFAVKGSQGQGHPAKALSRGAVPQHKQTAVLLDSPFVKDPHSEPACPTKTHTYTYAPTHLRTYALPHFHTYTHTHLETHTNAHLDTHTHPPTHPRTHTTHACTHARARARTLFFGSHSALGTSFRTDVKQNVSELVDQGLQRQPANGNSIHFNPAHL